MAVRKDTVQLEVIINGAKAGGTLKDMRGGIRDLKRDLDKLTIGTDAYNKKATELARATAAMNTHTKAIREQTAVIENAGRRTNTFTDTLKKGAIAAGLFFGIQQVVQWGKEFVGWVTRGTVALEDMRDKSERTFGQAIDIVQDFAKINAQALGVTEEKYVSLAAQIGAMLIPMGFTREEAAKMSAEALNLSAALSEWSNGTLTVEQTQEVLGKALLGQTKGLKQFGIAISEADIKTRLAADGNDKLTGAALKQAKAQATLALVMEQSKDAQAEFAASQEDLGRSAGRFSAAIAQVKENILSGLLPAFKSLGNTIANALSPLNQQSDQLSSSRDNFQSLIQTLQDGNLTYEGRADLIKRINTEYAEYLPNLLTESTTNSELSAILGDVNIQLERRIDLQLQTEKLLAAKKGKNEAAEEVNQIAKRIGEQEALLKRLKEQRGISSDGSFGDGDNSLGLKREITRVNELLGIYNDQLVKANQKLAIAGTHLLFIKNQSKDINADDVLNREADAQAKRDKIAADAEAEAARKAAAEQAEKDRQAREKRLRDNLKAIEDQYNKEKLLKIQSIESLRGDEDAYNRERERITIETDIKIANAQAALYKNGSGDNLRLLQSALDSEAKLRDNASKLSLAQKEEALNNESELRKLHIREEITDREDLSRALEIEELENLQRLDTAKLASLNAFEAEYKVVYNRISDRQQTIDEKRNEDTLAGIISTINITRDQKILALEEQQLTDEKYLEQREKIEIESIIDSLEAQLTLYEGSAEDRIALELKIADARRKANKQESSGLFGDGITIDNGGGRSTPGDREAQRQERLQQAKDATLDTAHNVADTLLSIERERIDETLRHEIDSIEQLADAKRRAAGDDAVELAKIDAQARAAREKAEKKAAQDRKKLARKEAIIQGALAVVEALPNAFAAIAAGIATALQLAVIDGQSFFYGGPTGSKGIYRDKSGKNVAGVVHTNEYVVPEHITQDPRHQPVISYLENVRRSKGGFAEGGFTSVSTRPAAYVQTVTGTAPSQELAEIRNLLADIKSITAAWPREVKARVVYTELEKVGEDLNYIRGQANA